MPEERRGPVTLELSGLAKAFGATQAVRSASLELRAGEIHAIVGENASGKSTTLKMLSGVHTPDRGTIQLDGRVVTFGRPKAARQAGMVTVFQEVLVAGARSVLDNVWAGADGVFRSALSANEREARAQKMLAELFAQPPELDTPLEQLSLSGRQACAIVRGLLAEPRVLILDESTSALDVETAERLFAILKRMASTGTAVLFTSHRMDEVMGHADRVTVMRAGETVAVRNRDELNSAELISLMSTGEERAGRRELREHAPVTATATPRLRVSALRLKESGTPIDFELSAGELVGLAGLEGHGQDMFLESLWGGSVAAGKVEVSNGGQPVAVHSPAQATRNGIVYVPRDRRDESLFDTQSILDNFAVATLKYDQRVGLLRRRETRRRFGKEVERLKIKFGRVGDDITTLSGGNQQKVILARWLAAGPQVLLLNDPTRGVDINVKRDLYALLDGLRSEGVAAVMLSTEVDEHLELMDRVLVFRENAISAELTGAALTRERLVAAFFGESRGVDDE